VAAQLCKARPIHVYPSAYSPQQRFGQFNGSEWRDGVVSAAIRQLSEEGEAAKKVRSMDDDNGKGKDSFHFFPTTFLSLFHLFC